MWDSWSLVAMVVSINGCVFCWLAFISVLLGLLAGERHAQAHIDPWDRYFLCSQWLPTRLHIFARLINGFDTSTWHHDVHVGLASGARGDSVP